MKTGLLFILTIFLSLPLFGEAAATSNGQLPCPECGILDLYLEMDPADLEDLYTRSPLSDERLPAVARLSPEGAPIATRGLRFRGSSSRWFPKKSFNIRFDECQDFLFGSSRMNVNAMYTDPSMMREFLAFKLFRDLGRPASRTRYFNLYVNGIYEGLYVQISRVDEDLLALSGIEADGTLVRDGLRNFADLPEVDRDSLFGMDLDALEDPEGFLQQVFSSRGDPDWSALADLARWVFQTPPGQAYHQGFVQRIDVENFIDWLALHFLIGDVDSFADDYWLFLPHDDPDARWTFIPWDKDLSLGSHSRPELGPLNDYFAYDYRLEGGWDNDLIFKFLFTPSLRKLLEARLIELVVEIFPESWWDEQVGLLDDLIEESVHRGPGPAAFRQHPQNHHGQLGLHPYHRETIRDFIRLRYDYIRRQLNPIPGAPEKAEANLNEYGVGDTVRFTDSTGWTIAHLEILEMEQADWVVLQSTPVEGIDGLSRVWTVDAGEAAVRGRLSLFYRNDVPWWLTQENWYPELEPVGRQWDLVVAEYPLEAGGFYSSRVNPYSNRITAEVVLQGVRRFAVIHSPERTGRRALFAPLLVSGGTDPEAPPYETAITIVNVRSAPPGDLSVWLGEGGKPAGTLEFHLWNRDGEPIFFETGPGAPGRGLQEEGMLEPGGTYTVLLSEILQAAGIEGSFLGYGWVIGNIDGIQGSLVVLSPDGLDSRNFTLLPGMGRGGRFLGGIPVLPAGQ